MTAIVPDLDLYDHAWPIWSYGEVTPPAKFVQTPTVGAASPFRRWSRAAVVSGAAISRSLLFTGVRVHSYSTVHETVVLPYAQIGRRARLTKAVIDAGVTIPDDLVVGEDPESTPSASGAPNPALLWSHNRCSTDWAGDHSVALTIAAEINPQHVVA